MGNSYTIFVVSGVIIAAWLALFTLLTTGRGDD
jgi:hypothetical protein